jgi:peptide-methionine (S)-S-oxide reductase
MQQLLWLNQLFLQSANTMSLMSLENVVLEQVATGELRVDGLITSGAVGFMGPLSAKENPNYEDVCTGVTGHVEVYDCEFTGGAPFYEAMVRFFFQFHDPTTMNKQGNDSGTQYASVIYCYDLAQYKIATAVKAELQLLLDLNRLTCFQTKVVSTDIRMVESDFFPAQQKHQDYLAKNPRVSLQNSSRSYEMIHTLICPKATHYSLVLNLTITSFLC